MLRTNIKRLHKKGLSDREIAEVLNVSQQTVNYHRQRLGLTNNYWKRHRVFNEKKFLKLYNEGKTDREIGIIMGYTTAAIIYHRKKLGLKSNEKENKI
ncbi:MAG: helix-turn-helix domain-containing protein [Methanophagales archaeon]|nr:helix-turn-helix domain-containing protein [Methanophagales archaeon]